MLLTRALPITLVLSSLLLSACTPVRGKREQSWPAYPQPRTQPSSVPGQPVPLPAPESVSATMPTPAQLPSYPRTAEEISGAAVISLFKQARTARDQGRPDQAAAALERALRIEPRNYFLWSALAGTQLERGNIDQAESVALKSNSLARGNVYAELENWRIIAAAREARGDAAAALSAQTRVAEIEQLLLAAPAPTP